MNLEMFLGNKLVDKMAIDVLKFRQPGYINDIREAMEEKNEDILDLSNDEPTFFIDSVPSSMNSRKRLF